MGSSLVRIAMLGENHLFRISWNGRITSILWWLLQNSTTRTVSVTKRISYLHRISLRTNRIWQLSLVANPSIHLTLLPSHRSSQPYLYRRNKQLRHKRLRMRHLASHYRPPPLQLKKNTKINCLIKSNHSYISIHNDLLDLKMRYFCKKNRLTRLETSWMKATWSTQTLISIFFSMNPNSLSTVPDWWITKGTLHKTANKRFNALSIRFLVLFNIFCG